MPFTFHFLSTCLFAQFPDTYAANISSAEWGFTLRALARDLNTAGCFV